MAHKLVRSEITRQDSDTRAVTRQLVVNCEMDDLGGKDRVERRERQL